jgi:hypothetical protein
MQTLTDIAPIGTTHFHLVPDNEADYGRDEQCNGRRNVQHTGQ